MTTDFRALCVELTDCLEKADWPHKQKHVFEQWLCIACKALAEPEPEGPKPQPVPVSERLPGPGDCDAEGRCWWLAPETAQKCAVWCFGPKYPPSMFGATHWLPAHALPIPHQQETAND